MYKKATHEMLKAAMLKAVETSLIPRHSLLAEYLKSWERLEKVIQAALEAHPDTDKFCGLGCIASEAQSHESKKSLAIPTVDMRH